MQDFSSPSKPQSLSVCFKWWWWVKNCSLIELKSSKLSLASTSSWYFEISRKIMKVYFVHYFPLHSVTFVSYVDYFIFTPGWTWIKGKKLKKRLHLFLGDAIARRDPTTNLQQTIQTPRDLFVKGINELQLPQTADLSIRVWISFANPNASTHTSLKHRLLLPAIR